MYEGYLQLGGTEIVNANRVADYVRKNLPQFPLKNCIECDTLRYATGEATYESPLVDDAPWADESNPATYDFYGVYPLEVLGMGQSTRSANVIESINDGGYVGPVRFTTREIRVKAMLVARTDLALEAGLTWLKAALNPTACADHGGSCGGASLCYYASCPSIDLQCFRETAEAGPVTTISSVTGQTSPTLFNLPDDGGEYQVTFRIRPTDGLVLNWGRRKLLNQDVLEEFGPAVSQRTNFITNPSFTTNTVGWTGTGVVLTRVASGGVDGGPHGRISGGGGSLITSVPDSPAGNVLATMFLRGTPGATVTAQLIALEDNQVVGTSVFELTDQWARYGVPTAYGREVYLKLVGTAGYDIDQVMLEPATTVMPYFDGASDPNTVMADFRPKGTGYTGAWLGAANASGYRITWQAEAFVDGWQEFGFDAQCDPLWRPYLDVDAGELRNGQFTYRVRPLIPVEEQVEPYERHYHDVTAIEGPLVIETFPESRLSGAAMIVDFVLVAATPFAYSSTRTIVGTAPHSSMPSAPWPDVGCTVSEVGPILDPDCPVPPAPPTPPVIENPCIDNPPLWQRTWLSIPATEISAWSQMLPTVLVSTQAQQVRQVRVRFYPNPFNYPLTAPTTRQNIMINPKTATLSYHAAAIGGTGGAAALTQQTATPPPVTGVSAYARSTVSTVATGTQYLDVRISNSATNLVTPGETYIFSAYVRGNTASQNEFVIIEWLDAASAQIGAALTSPTVVGSTNWVRRSISGTAPAGAVRARLNIRRSPVSGNFAVGNYIEAGAFLMEKGSTLGDYFDGDTLDANGFYYGWTGAANASASSASTSPVDPCSFCSEFIVSYVPPYTVLTVDGMVKRAYATVQGGGSRPASNLLYAGDGGPMSWSELSCGIPYLVSVDVPPDQVANVDFGLQLTRQE